MFGVVVRTGARRPGLMPLLRRVSRFLEKLALRRRQDRRVAFIHRPARKFQNRSPNPMPVLSNKHHVALGRQRQHTHPIRVFKHIIRRNIPPRRRPTMVRPQPQPAVVHEIRRAQNRPRIIARIGSSFAHHFNVAVTTPRETANSTAANATPPPPSPSRIPRISPAWRRF